MNNNFESQEWAENHQVMSDGIDRMITSIRKLVISRVRPETCDNGDQQPVNSSSILPDIDKMKERCVNVA